MNTASQPAELGMSGWMREKLLLGMDLRTYLNSLKTPFNGIVFLILCVGIPATVVRFTQGLEASTNLSNDYPWGLWIGLDVLCGVALAAGGFTIASAVHLFGLKKYEPIVRPALMTAFLGYFFVVVGLLFDLGRPWRLPYPIFVSRGVTSVMFEVACCVAMYNFVLFLEICPVLFEWLGWRKLRRLAIKITVGATAFGVLLSTMHQSALGGLFLIAPGKVHPLWYSSYIPLFFFISAIAAGLSMVIVESMLSHRLFSHRIQPGNSHALDEITLGLARGASVILFSYFCLKWLGVAHDNRWEWLFTGYGAWFLLEVLGFVLCPCLMYVDAVKRRSVKMARAAAVWTILGVVLNRLNVSFLTFNWQLSERYIPHWMELAVTLTIVTAGVVTFRAIVNRMPVLAPHPDFLKEE